MPPSDSSLSRDAQWYASWAIVLGVVSLVGGPAFIASVTGIAVFRDIIGDLIFSIAGGVALVLLAVGIVGVVFGRTAVRALPRGTVGRGRALAGLVMSAVGVVLVFGVTAIIVFSLLVGQNFT